MAAYQLSGQMVLRVADGAYIPQDPKNTDYQVFLAWRDQGNVPDPDPGPPPPSADMLDAAAARQYAKLAALRGMTPAQVQTWVDNNVVDLASAKDAIKTLAVAVCILARRL